MVRVMQRLRELVDVSSKPTNIWSVISTNQNDGRFQFGVNVTQKVLIKPTNLSRN